MWPAGSELLSFPKNHSVITGLALSGVILTLGYGLFRKWVGGRVCHSRAVLHGKVAIITGANTGIGLETAVDLAKRGARIILACRSVERGEKAAVKVRRRSGNLNVTFLKLDLASLDSIRAFADKVIQQETHLDLLINNAGVHLPFYQQTEDGFELTMAVNHLGHFLLTNLLLDLIKSSPSARIIIVSSSLYKRCSEFEFTEINSNNPSRFCGTMSRAYCQSKLANILFASSLSKRLIGTGVCVYTLHPGVINTELGRHVLEQFQYPTKVMANQNVVLLVPVKYRGTSAIIPHCFDYNDSKLDY